MHFYTAGRKKVEILHSTCDLSSKRHMLHQAINPLLVSSSRH